MSKTVQKLLLVGGTAFVLASCGDETNVTKVTNETTGMKVAASADSLGTCDSASVGKMMFASDENAVYICADSGWTPLSEKAADGKDGVDGLDGASCTVKTLSAGDGYKVICGGDSVGVILNSTDGSDGKNGNNGSDGKDGANGTSCSVFALPDSSGYKIVCGGDSVGVILNGARTVPTEKMALTARTAAAAAILLATARASSGSLAERPTPSPFTRRFAGITPTTRPRRSASRKRLTIIAPPRTTTRQSSSARTGASTPFATGKVTT